MPVDLSVSRGGGAPPVEAICHSELAPRSRGS